MWRVCNWMTKTQISHIRASLMWPCTYLINLYQYDIHIFFSVSVTSILPWIQSFSSWGFELSVAFIFEFISAIISYEIWRLPSFDMKWYILWYLPMMCFLLKWYELPTAFMYTTLKGPCRTTLKMKNIRDNKFKFLVLQQSFNSFGSWPVSFFHILPFWIWNINVMFTINKTGQVYSHIFTLIVKPLDTRW